MFNKTVSNNYILIIINLTSNAIEVIYIRIHLQSYPFKDIQPSYWLLLKILSSHWLRRVDIFKWITF